MALSENIKKSFFWLNTIKIGIVFVFFSTKVIAGFVYGVYVSNKNMK